MPSKDAQALDELARLCTEVRANLPDMGFHRLRVLLDMILVDLSREGVAAEAEATRDRFGEARPALPQQSS